MTCRELSDFILDYVAGDLPAPLCDVFERHLSACGNCRVYLATYRATLAAGRALGEDTVLPPLPEELVQAILAARRQDERAGN
jgi:anti-sigma factor RsiW